MASPDDALLTPARWEGKRCTVPQATAEIEELTPEQVAALELEKPITLAALRAKVEAATDDPRVPSKNVEKYLRDLIGDRPGKGNASPSHTTIHRHQIRECECPKP